MVMSQLHAIARRFGEFVVRNKLLPAAAMGFRFLRSITLREYCEASGSSFVQCLPDQVVRCPLPMNVGARESLSRDCGRYERSFFDVPEFRVAASCMATIPDCRIVRTRDQWGDDFYAIVTSDHRVVQFSGTSYRSEHAALLRSGKVCRTLDMATWITTHSTRNHYMWLYNHLSRLMLAEELGLQGQTLFPAKSLLSPVKLSTLDRLGYKKPQFIKEEDKVIYVKSLSLMVADGFDPVLLKRLRDRLVGVPALESRTRLYISREKCHYRKLKNELEIWGALENLGFEKVFLEELTLEQQIHKLHSADVVLGVHGAGFANVLFCRQGTRIIEIQDPEDPNPHFYALAVLLGLDYCLVLGDIDTSAEPHFRDISVNMSTIAGLLI